MVFFYYKKYIYQKVRDQHILVLCQNMGGSRCIRIESKFFQLVVEEAGRYFSVRIFERSRYFMKLVFMGKNAALWLLQSTE